MKKGRPNITLEALKKGDKRAFEKLYAANYQKLCNYLLNYTNDRKKIEDVVQDTFINLWYKRHQLTIQVSLKSYVYRMAYNKLMDSFREQQKRDSLLSEYYHTALMRAANLDEEYKISQLKVLKQCIEKLPTRCSEVFRMNKFENKKYQQVADELELSIKTVEGHISKAYKYLKDCMGA